MEGNRDEGQPLSWPTILFVAGTTLGATLWPLYAYFYGVRWQEAALAVAYFVSAGMSITVGYHRLFAHRSYQCRTWLKVVFLLFGGAAWQGSALEWAADHVRHHGYTDTPKDPYSVKKGVWHAHVGWLFRRQPERPIPDFLSDDRLLRWQDRYYIPLAVLVSFVVPYLLAGWGGLLLAGVVRIVIGHHVTWLINSWAHIGGNRPYDPNVTAADNWFLAFFTFGEGFHNFHHTFPHDYRNGVGTWAFDPSKWLIRGLAWFGVTYDLKRISPIKQWQRRVQIALAAPVPDDSYRARVRSTRKSLEAQLERTRRRLVHAIEHGHEYDLTSAQVRAELREWASRQVQDSVERMGDSARARVDRVRELIERLDAYQAMVEKLKAAEFAFPAAQAEGVGAA
jgi:stearoyl-CoA desaturase (delta-9 desaturase)